MGDRTAEIAKPNAQQADDSSRKLADEINIKPPPEKGQEVKPEEQKPEEQKPGEQKPQELKPHDLGGVIEFKPVNENAGPVESINCKDSPTFSKIIDTVIAEAYDVNAALELKRNRESFTCKKDSSDDAIDQANKALMVFDDPFTRALTKLEKEDEDESQEGIEYGSGLSVNISADMGKDGKLGKTNVYVTEVVPESPGANAGLKVGDKILSIDGTPVSKVEMSNIDTLLQGETDKALKLRIQRGDAVIEKSLDMQPFEAPSIVDRKLPGGMAYVQLRNFTGDSLSDDMEATLLKHDKAKGFVLDLRNNPGGSVESAVNIAKMFIDEGVIMEVKQRKASDPERPVYEQGTISITKDRMISTGSDPQDLPRDYPNIVNGRPVVILVNGQSASASEILTGALKGHDGITVIGSRTYGKGVGQMWTDSLPDGSSMHYTMMKFFDRNGHNPGDGSKNRLGISPDLEGRKQTYTARMPDAEISQALAILKAHNREPIVSKRSK